MKMNKGYFKIVIIIFLVSFSSSLSAQTLYSSALINSAGDGNNWLATGTANGPLILLKQHSLNSGVANRRGSLGWIDNDNNKTETLTWSDAGKVAIGILSGEQRLTIAGNMGLAEINAQRQFSYGCTGDNNTDFFFASATSSGNQRANGGINLNRLQYQSVGSGNDYADKVGIRISGYYDSSDYGLPVYIGGFSYGSSAPVMTITAASVNSTGGNVGIGIADPSNGKLQVVNSSGNTLSLQKTSGAGAIAMGSPSNDYAIIESIDGGGLAIFTRAASMSKAFVIDNTQNIGIGTETPKEKLSVNGNILNNGIVITKKVKVSQSAWSDYVFNDDYHLKPLDEVACFIKNNKHLPDVPSEKEVLEKGIDLGDNQALLLKKIEELTLYLIKQDQIIKQLVAENKTIKEKLQK